MAHQGDIPPGTPAEVPVVVHEATRSLLRLSGAAEARRAAEDLVRGLGGSLVSPDTADTSAILADVSFGYGEPVLVDAPLGSKARTLLDRHLTTFLLDASHALELSGRAERLAESASTDALTGLSNRRMLDRALGRLTDDDVVILLDLDHFKKVNDGFGHAAGDEVLRVFGRVLRSTARGRDFVGRFGGEEFAAVVGSPEGAEVFLERIRAEWLVHRPFPVTFSAGIARSVGKADETIALADAALYQAKDAGRDQWVWASAQHPLAGEAPLDCVEPYLSDAVLGRRKPAVRLTLDLLDNRVPRERIVVDLLAAAQRQVGDRWHVNELTAADEHLASGVAAAALDALTGESSSPAGDGGVTVVTCAEGDWHSLAAQMFGESLRSHGVDVRVLGASTPADVVADFLVRSGSDSLAISCSVPTFFPGAVHLADAAHRVGVPVMMGGRAFGTDSRRAQRLGADGWAQTAGEAAALLAEWRASPPSVSRGPTTVDAAGMRLFLAAETLGAAALAELADHLPVMADYDSRQLSRTREDLVFIVQFLGAAMLADDPSVFTDFVIWLRELLVHRGVSPGVLATGLQALQPLVLDVHPGATALLEAGHDRLVTAPA
ncbi:MAG: hypothetical protein K0Q93_932 [Nocardioidaceae bacterium]|nr:hypothetical protein [Nocardioidaceae bacterium]